MTRFSTRAIQAATRVPHVDQIASAVPIYQAAAFSAADAAELGDVLTGAVHGYAYSRIDNPTTAALAAAVAELEGAEAGLAFATGMAAIHAAIVSVVRAGQTIVVTNAVYGTTRDLLVRVLGGLGIAAEFVDPTDPAAVEAPGRRPRPCMSRPSRTQPSSSRTSRHSPWLPTGTAPWSWSTTPSPLPTPAGRSSSVRTW
jgi:O-acetylhomoserine/O-acetylserine sulfhydrylase-like pyridoxal-dependent enzyme